MKYRNRLRKFGWRWCSNFVLHWEFNFTHLYSPDPCIWCLVGITQLIGWADPSNPGSHSFMFVMLCFTVNLSIHFTNFIHFNFSTEVKHYLLIAHGSIKWKSKDLRSVYHQREFQVVAAGCYWTWRLTIFGNYTKTKNCYQTDCKISSTMYWPLLSAVSPSSLYCTFLCSLLPTPPSLI